MTTTTAYQTHRPVLGDRLWALALEWSRADVLVTGSGGTPTYVLNTNYVLDAANGRIQIVVGGGIADAPLIHVDYTPAAETRNRASGGTTAKRGALRVISDNAEGKNQDWFFTRPGHRQRRNSHLRPEHQLCAGRSQRAYSDRGRWRYR